MVDTWRWKPLVAKVLPVRCACLFPPCRFYRNMENKAESLFSVRFPDGSTQQWGSAAQELEVVWLSLHRLFEIGSTTCLTSASLEQKRRRINELLLLLM